jgi:hypothetical protein
VRRDVIVAVAIALLSAGSVVACGLTADFSGLQGGTRDAALGDVGPPVMGDAGSGDGAAGDAGDAGDAAAGEAGFCASLPTPVHLCADFDEGQAVGSGWSATDVSQGQTALVDYTYFSPPGSFLSQIAASTANGSAESARLQEDLPLDASHVHVEFEMLLPAAQGTFEICTLHEPVADGTTYGLFYKYEDGNLLVYVRALADDGGEVDYLGPIGPPPDGWLHVSIDTDVSESATIVVKQGGVTVLDAGNVNTSTLTRASMFVELGYYSFDPATTLAHFDDVIVDWEP